MAGLVPRLSGGVLPIFRLDPIPTLMMALLGGHGHEKGRTMKHRNSVLHGMLGYLPWQVFDDLVAAHGADKWVRMLSTKCQFVALLIGQLSGFCGLRETVAGVNSQAGRLYHLGTRARSPARRSPTPTRTARARCSRRCLPPWWRRPVAVCAAHSTARLTD